MKRLNLLTKKQEHKNCRIGAVFGLPLSLKDKEKGKVKIMMTLKIGEKELKVVYAYEPTLKSRLLSKLAKMNGNSDDADFEKIEDMLLFIPEMLLVGLYKENEEYRYNLDTKEGFEESLGKAFDLVGEYLDDENNDAIELSNMLQEELMKNGFLKKMFEDEVQKAKGSNKKK